jgi:DNA-binding transcriptional MerR regulator
LLDKLEAGRKLSAGELSELARFEGEELVPPGQFRTIDELARALNVSVRTVDRWVRDGLARNAAGLYALADVQAWRRARERRAETDVAEAARGDRIARVDAYRQAKTRLAEIELEERRGALISRAEVERDEIRRIQAVTQGLENLRRTLPARLEGRPAREIESILATAFDRLRMSFAGPASALAKGKGDD